MKKVVSKVTIVLLILTLLSGIGILGYQTDWFRDWKKFDIKEISSIESGVIISKKYGKFVIPEQNMFFSLNASSMVCVENNTDFTYFFDEIMDEIARVNDVEDVTKFKEENQMLFSTGKDMNHVGVTPNSLLYDQNYPYLNSVPYGTTTSAGLCLYLNNNVFQYDISKHLAFNGYPYPMLQVAYTSKEKLNNAVDGMVNGLKGLTYDETTYTNMAVRCLGRKVTMSIEGQDDITMIMPVMIISDKGYPMTEKVYNEIKKGI